MLPFILSASLTGLLVVSAHYVFQPPRWKLPLIARYAWGVLSVQLVGCGAYLRLAPASDAWALWLVSLALFGVAGAVTCACYLVDLVVDLKHERDALARRVGDE